MSDGSVQLIVGVYNDAAGADAAMKSLSEARKGGLTALQDVALVKRSADGKISITEVGEASGKKVAGIGAVAGAMFGLIAGPIGWMALGGAAVGSLAAKVHDSGFDNARLKKNAERLPPGMSAVVVVAESDWAERVTNILTQHGGSLIREEIRDELAAEMLANRDAVMKVLSEHPGAMTRPTTTGW
jgi:uncharacterized membrane protein